MHVITCAKCSNSFTLDSKALRPGPGKVGRSSMFKEAKIAIQCLWCKTWLKIELTDGKPQLSQSVRTRDSKESSKAEQSAASALAEIPMLIVTCPCCKQPYPLPEETAGKTVACLNCKANIQIPDLAEQPTAIASGAETEIDLRASS
jgi:hypothetical protein